jgi:outer membrane protein assembly factor BamB
MSIATTSAKLPLSLEAGPGKTASMDSKAAELGVAGSPAESQYGPHIRDIAVTEDGSVGVMNAMNWNENFYGLDLNSGKLLWQKRLGQAFTFAPQTTSTGFAVQGFDFNSPYSYYLYLTDRNGQASHRFGLYGLSRRLPQRFLSVMFNDRMNQFAVAPDASWVASCGDLGLAVWDKGGKLLWQRDDYKSTHNSARFAGLSNWGASRLVTPILAAVDENSLLVVDEDMKATSYNAVTGKEEWSLPLSIGGETRKVLVSKDHKTIAVLATTAGGRVFMLRGGKVVATIPLVADDIALSEDGNSIAAVNSTQLSFYEAGKGLRWILNGDEVLHNPRIAPDGRVAVSSQLGTLYVLDSNGEVLLQRDMKSLASTQWLAGGDLLVGTWLGNAVRLDTKYGEKWRAHLSPQSLDMRGKLLADDKTLSSEIDSWINAEAKAAPLTPNLLAQKGAVVTLTVNGRKSEALPTLVDGVADAPEQPLTTWGNINWLGEGTAQNWIEMELPGKARVSAISLMEDPVHPESWLRDCYLEYWDTAKEQWVFIQPLLSNSAAHTHKLNKPVEAARFRIMLPPGIVGNVRLGELVLSGDTL